MSQHPLNLTFRFILELMALASVGLYGYHLGFGYLKFLLALVFPLALAAIWGVFATPNDPSRSGKTVVPTPGPLRLLLELILFGLAIIACQKAIGDSAALGFTLAVVLHYAISWDRLKWLFTQ